MDLKCKACAYEHSVGPQFFKGTQEHKCPGCGSTGTVVIVIKEGGKVLEGDGVETPFAEFTLTAVSGGSAEPVGAEELTQQDEAPGSPEDPVKPAPDSGEEALPKRPKRSKR
jgi:hypothetical protein